MKPEAKKDSLLIEELPDETLVYDTKRHRAFCLNRTTAAVWQKCDGSTSTEQISSSICRELGIDRDKEPEIGSDLVGLALDRLARARLLLEPTRAALPAPRYSRRELAKRLASLGIAALIPTVFTINAVAKQAAATCVSVCNRFTVGACCCSNRRICTATGCNGRHC